MAFEKERLPKGWSLLPFGNIKPSTERFDPTKEENRRYVGLEHIEKNTGKIIGNQESKMAVSSKTVFCRGDLLYGKLRPCLNKVAVANFDGVCSTDILVFQQNSFIVNTFLKLCLLKSDFVEFANSTVTGVQHPRTSHKKLSDYPIPLPPLSEQHRIISKIESIFAQIDAAKEQFERLVSQTKSTSGSLDALKNSVLKQAFDGKLVPQDPRDESTESLLRRIHKDFTIEFEKTNLPKGWVRTSMENISVDDKYSIRMGPFGSQLKKHELVDSGIRVLWIENIVNNKFENKKEKFITNEKYETLKGFSVKPNDILITMMGTVGRTCVVPPNIGKTIISSHLLKITPHIDLIDSIFLTYLIRGNPQILKQIESKSRGVVMKGLNTKIIKSLEFSLPPLNEQKRIVTKIESIFGNIDSIEKQVNDAIRSLNTLKQSVLKLAFEGKLVPQDPSDEPASVLLEKIKLQKK